MREDLAQIITHFTAAMKGMVLYPPGHPAIRTPVEKCTEIMRPLLFQKSHLLLGVVDKVLVFEGVPFQRTNPAIDEFIARLEEKS